MDDLTRAVLRPLGAGLGLAFAIVASRVVRAARRYFRPAPTARSDEKPNDTTSKEEDGESLASVFAFSVLTAAVVLIICLAVVFVQDIIARVFSAH